MDIICRSLKENEYFAAAQLEKECLHTAWSESQIASMPENGCYLGAFIENELCGIGSAYFVSDECQIMNIAVTPVCRKRGVGTEIMTALIKKSLEKGCDHITLEVAEDNAPAIALYEKSGFAEVGRRRNFYGSVSAFIMEKKL